MSDYEIIFLRTARKELEALPAEVTNRIFLKILDLSSNRCPTNCRKLVGSNSLWRIRVGNYRVIYSVDDLNKTVEINAVRHRSKAYE